MLNTPFFENFGKREEKTSRDRLPGESRGGGGGGG